MRMFEYKNLLMVVGMMEDVVVVVGGGVVIFGGQVLEGCSGQFDVLRVNEMLFKEIFLLKLFLWIFLNIIYYRIVEDSFRKSYSFLNGFIWVFESEMCGCIIKNMMFVWIIDDKKK